MGLIVGIWAEKFDQLAGFQNFVIVPATFLSGVFYSINSLPPIWQTISHFNPFFYMIDGFRYGFSGQSDVDPVRSLVIVTIFLLALTGVAMQMLRSGYKLRHWVHDWDHSLTWQESISENFLERLIVFPTPDQIKNYIASGLECTHLEVEGDGQHFTAVIVSPAFAGKRLIQRHQLVYAALGDRMREEIHALSMKTLTPEEFQ